MRLLSALLLSLLIGRVCAAQSPDAAAPAPQPSWGGYALPTQVPYQPTLDGAPAATVSADPNQAWQPYPTPPEAPVVAPPIGSPPPGTQPDAVYLDGAPPASHELAPGAPLYPGTNEPSLRESLIPPGSRDGFFQGVGLEADYLPSFGSDNLGWTDVRTEVVTALPFFTRENPIIITPSYEVHFLDRPVTTAPLPSTPLPPTLHDLAMDFHVFRVYDNHWIVDVAVTPGVYADEHSFGSSEAWRVNGRAVGVYAPTIDLKYALGVTYVDGGWSKIVPVAGVIYKPNDDAEYELVFPTPKISWRLPWSPIPGRDERWLTVAVDYGNSAWAFQQSSGATDVLFSRDYRLILGLERKIVGGCSHKFEIGYVFNRDIKMASLSGDQFHMDDTLMVRFGVSY